MITGDPSGRMEPTGSSPVKKVGHEKWEASSGAPAVGSKFVGPGLAETVHASENFEKVGLVAAHLAALHDAYMLERGLLPGTSLPDSEAPPIPPVYAESPWKDLKSVSLADMKVGKTHRRHVLEGCLCVKSLKIHSVVNVLEEDSGLATKLILTNAVPVRASMAQAQCCYPEGARVAVRDPYLTRFPDGMVGVLVERPADIAFLSRPESNGENGTTIYESIGSKGYHDERDAEHVSRDNESFSRKLHLFEQQLNHDSSHTLGINESDEKHHRVTKTGLVGKQVRDTVDSEIVARGSHVGASQQDLNNIRIPEVQDVPKKAPSSTSLEESSAPEIDSEVMKEGSSSKSLVDSSPREADRVVMKEAPSSNKLEEVLPPEADSAAMKEGPFRDKVEEISPPEADTVTVNERPSSGSLQESSSPQMDSVVMIEETSSNNVEYARPPEADSVVMEEILSSNNFSASEAESMDLEEERSSNNLEEFSSPEVESVVLKEELSSNILEESSPAEAEGAVMKDAAGELDVETPGGAESVEASHDEEDNQQASNTPQITSRESLEESELGVRELHVEPVPQEPLQDAGSAAECSEEIHKNVEEMDDELERSVAEEDSRPTGPGESASQEQGQIPDESDGLPEGLVANDTHVKTAEGIPEARKPGPRKQFLRSDSLLAVQEVEDSLARAGEWATGAAVIDEYSKGKAGHTARADVSCSPEEEPGRESPLTEERSSDSCSVESAPTDPLDSASAHDLRVLGNQLFAEEDYQGATNLYTKSILRAEREEQRFSGAISASEVLLGYSNRAEAWIRLDQYEKALEDAGKALSRDPSHLKSLFRKGRALLGLGQYEEALSTLQVAAPRAPSDKDLQAAMHESNVGIQQSRQGVYDLANYYLKGKQMGEAPLCADYLGPVIVSDVGRGRGRGLVLTKDVEAGELLLVSNPVAFLQLQGLDQTRDEIAQAFVSGKVQEAFRKICENAHASNKGLQKLPMLFDGERNLPAPPVNLLSSSSNTDYVAQEPLDATRMRRIIQLNAINGNATMGWKNLPGSGEQDQKVEHWGLWWLPSFMNHSCLPSSSPILVGRALFVFASRDLRAGDEVTRSYFDIFQPLEQRRELSTKGWGFVCHCPRCKLEDALHGPLSKVTRRYMKLMELASRSKSEYVTDERLSETQTSAALKFFQKLESKLKDFKLNAAENNWVRSSFLHYIDMINGDHELHPHLESVVEAMATVCPGSESTLHMAVVAKDSARRTRGKKSAQFKSANQRALNICRSTYGKLKLSLLQSIVDKSDYQV